MHLSVIDDHAKGKNRADILDNAKKNAVRFGGINKDGNAFVNVKDLGEAVQVSPTKLKHGLDRRASVNGPVTENVGEILSNSILINELNPRNIDSTTNTYALIGAAKNAANELYIVEFVVNRMTNELEDFNVLYSLNAKKEPGALLPSARLLPTPITGSTISISNLLEYVNQYYPDILPEDVLKHFGHESRPKGKLGASALYQQWSNEEYEELTGSLDEDQLYSAITERKSEENRLREQITEMKVQEKEWVDRVSANEATLDDFQAWTENSGYKAMLDRKGQLEKEIRMLYDRWEKARDNRLEQEEKEALEKSGFSENEHFGKQAVKVFGYTPYFYDAGYIMSNGKMLNFSGEKGKHRGSRGQDHRAIGQIFATTQNSAAMTRFMNYGNIRIMGESPGIDISSKVEPTAEQYRQIKAFARNVADEEYSASICPTTAGTTWERLNMKGQSVQTGSSTTSSTSFRPARSEAQG